MAGKIWRDKSTGEIVRAWHVPEPAERKLPAGVEEIDVSDAELEKYWKAVDGSGGRAKFQGGKVGPPDNAGPPDNPGRNG